MNNTTEMQPYTEEFEAKILSELFNKNPELEAIMIIGHTNGSDLDIQAITTKSPNGHEITTRIQELLAQNMEPYGITVDQHCTSISRFNKGELDSPRIAKTELEELLTLQQLNKLKQSIILSAEEKDYYFSSHGLAFLFLSPQFRIVAAKDKQGLETTLKANYYSKELNETDILSWLTHNTIKYIDKLNQYADLVDPTILDKVKMIHGVSKYYQRFKLCQFLYTLSDQDKPKAIQEWKDSYFEWVKRDKKHPDQHIIHYLKEKGEIEMDEHFATITELFRDPQVKSLPEAKLLELFTQKMSIQPFESLLDYRQKLLKEMKSLINIIINDITIQV